MRRGTRPRRILEVGPGTGAVTQEIVRRLEPGDQFDIVEINGKFVEVIRTRFKEEPEFKRSEKLSKIIHAPLQEVPGEAVYDFMISGLPLNNFPLDLVKDIFASYRRLLKPTGILSYFEYVWIRDIKLVVVGAKEKERLKSLDEYLGGQIEKHEIGHEIVVPNVPPAVARHFRFA